MVPPTFRLSTMFTNMFVGLGGCCQSMDPAGVSSAASIPETGGNQGMATLHQQSSLSNSQAGSQEVRQRPLHAVI